MLINKLLFNYNKIYKSVHSKVIIKRSLVTVRSLSCGTFLTRSGGITIFKRFGSKGPKPIQEVGRKTTSPGIGNTPKPLPPSSLNKHLPLKGEPKPMSLKHYNHNNVGGPKPLPPFDPSRDSYKGNPTVVWALQQGYASSSSTIPNSSPNVPTNNAQNTTTVSNVNQNPSTLSNTTQSASNVNTSTSSDQPLTPMTGALILYETPPQHNKPNSTDHAKTTIPTPADPSLAPSTFYVNSHDTCFLDHAAIPVPPPLPKIPLSPQQNTISSQSITNDSLKNAKTNLKPPKPLKPFISENTKISNDKPSLIAEKASVEFSTDTFSEEILAIQKTLSHPPLEIPKETLIPYLPLEKDKSVIKQEALRLSKELSDQQILKELARRGFIKVAEKNAVTFKTISGDTIVIGESKNKVKVTPFAKAYIDEITEESYVLPQSPIKTEEHVTYYLVALRSKGTSIVSNGLEKHAILVYDKGDDVYYIIGYLTSNSSSYPFEKQQFKIYHDAREANKDPSTMPKSKLQNFAPCKNALLVKKDQLIFLKWGTNYLQDLSIDAKNRLESLKKTLETNPFISYDGKGFSKETLVRICMSFDNHIIKKIPHPKTYIQILKEKKISENNAHMKEKKVSKQNLHACEKENITTPFNE